MRKLLDSYGYTKKAYVLDMTFAFSVLILISFIVFVTNFWLSTVVINQSSMTNTLHEGDILILNELKKPDYGEIVVFDSPTENSEEFLLIKRVIAMGGDSIKAKDEVVYLKKKGETTYTPLDELSGELGYKIRLDTRVPGEEKYCFDEFLVPEGYVFVLGDNRYRSNDSHGSDFTFISEKSIKGVVSNFCVKHKNFTTFLFKKIKL